LGGLFFVASAVRTGDYGAAMGHSRTPSTESQFDAVALAAVVATVLVWGGSYTAIRIALAGLTPAEIAVIRYFVAAVVGAIYLVGVRSRWPTREEFVRLGIVGVLYVLGFAVLLNWGQETVSAGTAGFVVGTSPVLIAMMAVFALGEPFGRLSTLGALISFAGVGLIAFGSGDRFTLEFGVILVFGAALSAAAASVIQKPLLTNFTAVALTAWILLLGVVPLLPVLPNATTALLVADGDVIWAVAFLAVFSTIIGYVSWSTALKRMSAGRAGSFLNCVPLAATAIGFMVLGEVPTATGLVGGLLALTGVIVVNAAKGR
jgi:drug/metabolite transporter (DMT)-like permease